MNTNDPIARRRKIIVGAIILGIILILALIIVLSLRNNEPSKTLTLPEFQNVQSLEISFSGMESPVSIKEPMKIYDIYDTLENEAIYVMPSVSDTPVNERVLKIKLNTSNSGDLYDVYLYQMDQTCYLEQPYNGIFEISRISYENLLLLFSTLE